VVVAAHVKDPQEVLDYPFDWSGPDGLDTGDTITASTWVAAVGNPDAVMTISSPSFTTTKTVVTLSGGTVGKEYWFTNHVTTAQSRQHEKSLLILCLEK
jgi:hypothetical protein